jgi:nucleotide-binding universal stress UspA family protein
MYTTIVVGTDGSGRANQAVHKAAKLASTCGAKIHLVHAFQAPVLSSAAMAPELGMAAPINLEQIGEDASALVEKLRAELEQQGLAVETHAVADAAASALLDVAATVGADAIVVGNRGMTGARRFLGSVPSKVSHHADCDVIIVHTS